MVLTFVASTHFPGVADYLEKLYASGPLFDDDRVCCFVVTNDVLDERYGRLTNRAPGIRAIWDTAYALARTAGVVAESGATSVQVVLTTFVLDPCQRVMAVIPVTDLASHFEAVRSFVDALPHPTHNETAWAPVLVAPNLLEPALCQEFIDAAEQAGLEDSGFMSTDVRTGKTIGVLDHRHKRRFDCLIEDERLKLALQARVLRRLAPQIEKAFQFRLSRMERYLVACYESDGGGWFRPHKDNTTKGTAHRRFAISIALNDGFEGGGVRFPEFGPRVYNPPLGGALVFSCSLLHEAVPVTSGRRYCLLPFVYDEAAARLRLENAGYFADQELAQNVVESVGDVSTQSAVVF